MKTRFPRQALGVAIALLASLGFGYEAAEKTVFVEAWNRSHVFEIPLESTVCTEHHRNEGGAITYGTAIRISSHPETRN